MKHHWEHNRTVTPEESPDADRREVYRCRACLREYWQEWSWYSLRASGGEPRDSECRGGHLVLIKG